MTAPEQAIEEKMRAGGVGRPAIQTFLNAVRKVSAGERGLIPESSVEPVTTLPALADLDPSTDGSAELLPQLAVIKLNGGLGTSMGLDGPKSLIKVKGEDTFLDFIARQILYLRHSGGSSAPAFYLMNSFATRSETLAYLRKYPALWGEDPLDFLQNKVPKLEATSLAPVRWPDEPELEWCPPGHGDLYPALVGSGLLQRLLSKGIRYLFVSNSDNLGAAVDRTLLRYFAQEKFSFLMEVAIRTAADRKGGHLARHPTTGRLLLRESAQCPASDEAAFQDIARHRFFNTNNLWIRLDHLQAELDRNGGSLALPLITNTKTVDPKKADSPKVLQIESAMGAAIECFPQAGAIAVPRTRFAPVKTTTDLLALRSDAYAVTPDWQLILDPSRGGEPPVIELDSKHYKLISEFDRFFPQSAPSLVRCKRLAVAGPLQFAAGVRCEGEVSFTNRSGEIKTIAAGIYSNATIE